MYDITLFYSKISIKICEIIASVQDRPKIWETPRKIGRIDMSAGADPGIFKGRWGAGGGGVIL